MGVNGTAGDVSEEARLDLALGVLVVSEVKVKRRAGLGEEL